jgi:acyl-CoA dehydrogenase
LHDDSGRNGQAGFFSLASGYGIHSNIVAPYINNIATEQQKEQSLPRMASGEIVAAIAMTEPCAGSDSAGMRTSAVNDGDEYILNGSKTFITNGVHADLVIVCAKTDPSAGSKGISLFLVDTSLLEFSRGKKIEKMGSIAAIPLSCFSLICASQQMHCSARRAKASST